MINSGFFKHWSSDMTYVLGFIVADGSVCKRKNRRDSYYMNITNKERKHLERINEVMSSQYALGRKGRGGSCKKEYSYIQVSNKEICKNLISLGIVPRKTYNLDPIRVPDEYFPDFVRGFFDGDGSVYIYKVNKTSQIKVGFVSASLPFITHFNKNLCNFLGIIPKTIHKSPKRERRIAGYSICFYINDSEKLAEFMYGNNPSLYLSRKRQIFEKWKTIKRRHYIKQNYPSKIGWRLSEKTLA